MTRLTVILTLLGLAAPALAADRAAARPAVMSDAQLVQVTAGCGGASLVPSVNTNVNVSPIIVNQTAVAFSQQQAANAVSSHGRGHAWGRVDQQASNVAMNYLNINYHPKF